MHPTKTDDRSGGLNQTRRPDLSDPFEAAVAANFSSLVQASPRFAEDLWGALCNVYWIHKTHGAVGGSFRYAGDLVAALRGEGNYLDWYCTGRAGKVPKQISSAMEAAGWTHQLQVRVNEEAAAAKGKA